MVIQDTICQTSTKVFFFFSASVLLTCLLSILYLFVEVCENIRSFTFCKDFGGFNR